MQNLFERAVPVWERGKACEKNYTLLFRTILPKGETVSLRLTGASTYQVFVNGELLATGPARAAHGFYRVDELSLEEALDREKNVLVIQVAGYYINTFYLLEQPAFLCAEVFVDGVCIAATGKEGFCARAMKERVQKVQRYTYQRTFVEVYQWDADVERFQTDPSAVFEEVVLEVQDKKQYLERGVYYPLYEKERAAFIREQGRVGLSDVPVREYKDRSLCYIGESLRGYRQEELDVCITDELCRQIYKPEVVLDAGQENMQEVEDIFLKNDRYVTLSFGKNLSGAVEFEVECSSETALYMTFDEIQTEDDYGFRLFDMANVVMWHLEPGTYHLRTFEPYTMQYLRFASIGGECMIRKVCMRRYGYPELQKTIRTDNIRLQKIFDAAMETFRQNAFDIFMDCPSRERAGWLCDSFFMGRCEYVLTGKNQVERNFLENYAMAFNGTVPEGMVPMCYPSDSELKAEYIPQWGIWFVLELCDYYRRSQDEKMLLQAWPRVEALLGYFKRYENEYGLLERLDGVQMVEWSDSKKYMNDVNFPTNMLYAKMLECVGRAYGRPELAERAGYLKKRIYEMSFRDGFFVDNAVRDEDDILQITRNKSECCQYIAFFTDVADMDNSEALWQVLVRDFGFQRRTNNKWEEVAYANAFIGNYLRMELLCRYGEHDMLLHDIEEYFYYMAEKTGTLWEYEGNHASCNHGFASYILYLFNELGMIQ